MLTLKKLKLDKLELNLVSSDDMNCSKCDDNDCTRRGADPCDGFIYAEDMQDLVNSICGIINSKFEQDNCFALAFSQDGINILARKDIEVVEEYDSILIRTCRFIILENNLHYGVILEEVEPGKYAIISK